MSLTRVLDAVGDMILIEKDSRGDNETLDANGNYHLIILQLSRSILT